MRNVLTFDVEDWYQGMDIPTDRWSSFERRLSVGLEFILETLAQHDVQATFFVLGVTARENPHWVRRIRQAGHEVGTHGWTHTPIYRQSRGQFRCELERALGELQDLLGERVHGHRAAFFSITERSPWAAVELAAAGLCYDSSIFPVRNYRYGAPGARRFAHRLPAALWELPISTLRIAGCNVPFGGGFYMRFWHFRLLKLAIELLNQKHQPAVIYFHPWEFDATQPRLHHESFWLARVTHYHRLGSTRETLKQLLSNFQWTSAQGYLGSLSNGDGCSA